MRRILSWHGVCAPLPFAAAGIVAGLAFFPALAARLAWQRDAIQEGAWWLVVSGHLAHWDTRHALLNAGGALLLGWYFNGAPLRFWVGAAIGAVLVCGVGLYAGPGALDEYRGLSVLLYGWLVAALLEDAAPALRPEADPRRQVFLHRSAAAGVVALVVVDACGLVPARSIAADVSVHAPAHLYGIVGGVAGAWAAGCRPASAPVDPG